MNWWALATLFAFSIIKFMFTPFTGPGLQLSFLETYFACVAGGLFGSSIFFFSAGYFMRRARENQQKKNKARILKGLPIKTKKRFTRMNKLVVRLKSSIGIVGICFWAPFFLSIPVGSIVAAKFYGDNKKAYPLIVLGMLINGTITTGIAYLSYG
jgi:hypothetical protein